MILFWFIIGMLAIIAIARYNEDDRLFWKLTLSFVFAFTATTVAIKVLGDKQDESALTEQVCPTQVLTITTDNSLLAVVDSEATISEVTAPVPVSKDNTLAVSENSSSLNEVYGWSRDQPPRVINVNGKLYPLIRAFGIDSS